MKPYAECGRCTFDWVMSRVEQFLGGPDSSIAQAVSSIIADRLSPSVNLGSVANAAVSTAFAVAPGFSEHYEKLKKMSNENALALLGEAVRFIDKGGTEQERFKRTCFLAATANVAPVLASSGAYTFDEVRDAIQEEGQLGEIADNVYAAVQSAGRVMYITDNAGEIGFDLLVLRHLKEIGLEVNVVVKDVTFIEDATLTDATFFGLERLVDRIVTSNGFFVPQDAPAELSSLISEHDLIIAKGMGSYEALRRELPGKRIIHMLKVKCNRVAEETRIDMGRIAVFIDEP